MLIVLFFLALLNTLHGLPLASSLEAPHDFQALDLRDTQLHLGRRALNDIIISCFATIFACTWGTVHPNIPATTDCWWTCFKRQVITMIYAILAPEAMSAWALKQRLSARYIMDEYNEKVLHVKRTPVIRRRSQIRDTVVAFMRRLFFDSSAPAYEKDDGPKWTLTHGFFVAMGGFVLSERGKPILTLTLGDSDVDNNTDSNKDSESKTDILWNIDKKKIDVPLITEVDIRDRSKGDAISKTLIVLQTTWFILQCLARWSADLPITELEVITLGFAILNGITYGLWWNKPQNVRYPVLLERKPRTDTNGIPVKSAPREATPATVSGMVSNAEPSVSPPAEVLGVPLTIEKKEIDVKPSASLDIPKQGPGDKLDVNSIIQSIEKTASVQSSTNAGPIQAESWLRKKLREDSQKFPMYIYFPFLVPLPILEAMLRPLHKMATNSGKEYVRRDSLQVPMFYSGRKVDSKTFIITGTIGVLFGSVHLISGWYLEFSSLEERWLWPGSSFVITVGPALLGTWASLDTLGRKGLLRNTIRWICTIGIPFYVLSRVALIAQSLISLRALPPAAFQTIDWTTFLPHI